MKKGMTLLEITMVLVIVGILFFLTVRGSALLENSRWKMEVSKINNLELGWVKYMSGFNNFIPTPNASGIFSNTPLIDNDYIKASTLTAGFGLGTYQYVSMLTNTTNDFIISNTTFAFAGIKPTNKLSMATYCKFELLLRDDGGMLSGNIRTINKSDILTCNVITSAQMDMGILIYRF